MTEAAVIDNSKINRKIADARAASRKAMITFREGRKAMGFVHTSCYIPDDHKDAFQIYVDRLKCDHMLAICAKEGATEEKAALAQCNYVTMPSPPEVHLVHHQVEDAAIRKLCKQVIDHLEKHNAAKISLKMVEGMPEEQIVDFICLAVAHSNYAAYLWKLLKLELQVGGFSPLKGIEL